MNRCNCDRPSVGGDENTYYHRDTCPKAFREPPAPDDDGVLCTPVDWKCARCNRRLECGGVCVLAANHVTPCECAGDDPGYPGSCPA